jgi:hypothetical protein
MRLIAANEANITALIAMHRAYGWTGMSPAAISFYRNPHVATK